MSGNLLVRFDEGRVGRTKVSPSLLLYREILVLNPPRCRKRKTRRKLSPRRAVSFEFDPVFVTSWSPSHRGTRALASHSRLASRGAAVAARVSRRSGIIRSRREARGSSRLRAREFAMCYSEI